jgi:hypothetical protein
MWRKCYILEFYYNIIVWDYFKIYYNMRK